MSPKKHVDMGREWREWVEKTFSLLGYDGEMKSQHGPTSVQELEWCKKLIMYLFLLEASLLDLGWGHFSIVRF